MRRLIGLVWFIATLLTATAATAQTERRVALVIGNGAYQAGNVLPNPPNDARAVAATLETLGFEVTLGIDLSRNDTERLVRQFDVALDGADTGLFFYAGHALQVDGVNYIIPVDAVLERSADLAFEAVRLDVVLHLFDRPDFTGVVLLDASRDNPLARAMSAGPASVARGLAPMEPPPGTLIVSATQPGNVALDGEGAHSPFTQALLNHIATPDMEIRAMLDRVAEDVRGITAGGQVPYVTDRLLDPFTLDPRGAYGRGTGAEPDDGTTEPAEPLPSLEELLNGANGGMVGGPIVQEPEGADTDDGADAAQTPAPVQAEPAPVAEEVAEAVADTEADEGGTTAPDTVAVSRYPVMDLPEQVLPGEPFALVAWLSRVPLTPEVETAPGPEAALGPEGQLEMTLPAEADWTFRLVLNAPGFRMDTDGGAGPVAEIAMDADGDSTPALWLLTAEPGAHPDGRATLSATLWHGATYLARIERTIAVGVTPAAGGDQAVLKPPPQPVQLNATTLTADLTVRIDYADPARLGAGQVIVASPYFHDPLIVGAIDTPADVASWLDLQYGQFVAARHRDIAAGWRGGTHPGAPEGTAAYDGPITEPLLRGFGRELWRRYAPDVFKQALWALVDDPAVTLETIQVYSNNPLLPWELMRPVSADGERELDYLGVGFLIARWHAGAAAFDRPQQELAFDELVAIAPHYETGEALGNVAGEIAALRDVPGFREVPGRLGDLRSLFDEPLHGIIHFAGHGVVAADAGAGHLHDYAIRLEDQDLNVMAWRGLSAGQADDGVFYFFNACDVGRADYVANFVEGWAPAVLDAGAAGFIGGLWPVFDDSAAAFAGAFYADIDQRLEVGPAPVAAVLKDLRARFAETGDPTWLSYVYYGDVNLRLVRD